MILILSDRDEPTTDLIVEWLVFQKKKFARISANTPLQILKIYKAANGFEAVFKVSPKYGSEQTIDTKEINSFWYRRSRLTAAVPLINNENKNIEDMFNNYIQEEYKAAVILIYKILENKKNINKFHDSIDVCKIYNLQIAEECGLKVPDSIICTNKEDLKNFDRKYKGNIITKPIGDSSVFFKEGLHFFTSKVKIDTLPDQFAISLFQENIQKEFELRIFYFDNTFYSSAVLSQHNSSTKVDLKNTKADSPNRVLPFELPKNVSENLKKFLDKINLKCGSIDMIYSKKGEYIFLEVNPIGQFEQVSIPCNYNLFKKVAEFL
jgi:ATP-GRASP peptide maturase of grasp-with-spasm system